MGAFQQATVPYYHPQPWRISELVMEFGNTKRVAEELGVSQRQIQRYLAYESGNTSKQARSTKRIQPKLDALGARLNKPPSARGREGVVMIVTGKIRVRSSRRRKPDDERTRKIDWQITDGEWSRLVQLAHQEGGEGAAAHYFFEDLYGAAGMSLLRGVVEAV